VATYKRGQGVCCPWPCSFAGCNLSSHCHDQSMDGKSGSIYSSSFLVLWHRCVYLILELKTQLKETQLKEGNTCVHC
jgi:hypothetical protein